ncbi:hypothetical protein [Paenibacillus sp. QZ-Y1]|uniref:hypothetical protein n=1 Tax=Paenibacillus sp. QZ-Y1 TaxID=3414511 RepID=UPI003F79454E
MTRKRKKRTALFIIILAIIGTYVILNRIIILDRTDRVLGSYDFVITPADVELLVEGTGKQNIKGNEVTTNIKILNIKGNKTSHDLAEGSEIEVNEYFVVYNNIRVSGLPIPGRSVYSMGTSYKRLKKGEQKTVYLKLNKETNKFWIKPDELVED